MEDGLVYNAMDGAKKLGITPDELGKKYDALKKGEGIIKFGGGFYCGKVDDIYVTCSLTRSLICSVVSRGLNIYIYIHIYIYIKIKFNNMSCSRDSLWPRRGA